VLVAFDSGAMMVAGVVVGRVVGGLAVSSVCGWWLDEEDTAYG